jgi:hypothetical protein
MTKKAEVYTLLFLSLLLFLRNIYQLDFDNLKNGPTLTTGLAKVMR